MYKTKELLPFFVEEINDVKDLNKFLNNRSKDLKIVLFNDDDSNIPLFYKQLSNIYGRFAEVNKL